jgi:hypothetical protein
MHPYQQLKTVLLDGTPLQEAPFDSSDPFGPMVASGQFVTVRTQPDGDPLEPPQHVASDPQLWLKNIGGCCRPSSSATFSFPEDFVPGRHRLNVRFEPISYQLTPAIKEDLIAPTTLEQAFTIFGPEVELSSTSLSPGQALTVNGTGFAPNATVRVFAKVKSFSAGEREVELGTEFRSTPTAVRSDPSVYRQRGVPPTVRLP